MKNKIRSLMFILLALGLAGAATGCSYNNGVPCPLAGMGWCS
jgi:hypothetical protein